MRKLEPFTIVLVALFSPMTVLAVDIPFGPEDSPPGAGVEVFFGDAALLGGATLSYTDIDLSETGELYFGVQNDTFPNGFSSDGVTISLGETFRYRSSTANSITYGGETVFETDEPSTPGVWNLPTRITYTFTGPGELVFSADTIALNGQNGDVTTLWHVQGDFAVDIAVEVLVAPPFDFNFNNWEPANLFVNRLPSQPSVPGMATATSFDWGFYYSLPPVAAPTPTEVPALGAWATAVLLLSIMGGAHRQLRVRIAPIGGRRGLGTGRGAYA